jgi:hypothetical protein
MLKGPARRKTARGFPVFLGLKTGTLHLSDKIVAALQQFYREPYF